MKSTTAMFRPSGISKVVMIAACLPFVLAIMAHARGFTASPIANAKLRPALAFEQYMVDLGEAPPSEQVTARFAFTNMSSRPVKIREYQPSCGCLQPRLLKKEYQSSESGEFLLRVQTANEAPGPKEYTLTVKYDDPEPREVVLLFRVTLPDNQVTVRPRALIFYQLSDTPTTQEIIVSDRRPLPLRLEGVTCSADFASVDVGETDVDENGHRRMRVLVTAKGDIPTGRHRALVKIFTNDATYQELKVPLIIEKRPAGFATKPTFDGTFPRPLPAVSPKRQ